MLIASTIPAPVEWLIASIAVIGALAVVYVYGVSRVRKETIDLQESANEAQAQLIETLNARLDAQEQEIGRLRDQNARQADQIDVLRDLVTHAQGIDDLRQAVEAHQEKVDQGFQSIHRKIADLPVGTGGR